MWGGGPGAGRITAARGPALRPAARETYCLQRGTRSFILCWEFCDCPSSCLRHGALLEKGLLFCLCQSRHATV